jgi:hypothetical protein
MTPVIQTWPAENESGVLVARIPNLTLVYSIGIVAPVKNITAFRLEAAGQFLMVNLPDRGRRKL